MFAKTPEEWINSQLCHTSDLPGLGYVLLDLLVSVGAGTCECSPRPALMPVWEQMP